MVTIQTQKRTTSLYYIFLKFDRMFKECQQIIEKYITNNIIHIT